MPGSTTGPLTCRLQTLPSQFGIHPQVKLQILDQKKDILIAEVLDDGIISNNKGVNIPGVILPISSLTAKDKSDLNKALEMGVDWIALSFVQTDQDIKDLQKIINGKA